MSDYTMSDWIGAGILASIPIGMAMTVECRGRGKDTTSCSISSALFWRMQCMGTFEFFGACMGMCGLAGAACFVIKNGFTPMTGNVLMVLTLLGSTRIGWLCDRIFYF